jgi:hypothetical protein
VDSLSKLVAIWAQSPSATVAACVACAVMAKKDKKHKKKDKGELLGLFPYAIF